MGAPADVTKWLTPRVDRTAVVDTEDSPSCTNKSTARAARGRKFRAPERRVFLPDDSC